MPPFPARIEAGGQAVRCGKVVGRENDTGILPAGFVFQPFNESADFVIGIVNRMQQPRRARRAGRWRSFLFDRRK